MSNIEWTEKTWNPVTGCTRVSPGCDHCYAVTMTHRLEGMERARRPRNGTEEGRKVKPGEKYVGLTVLNPRGDRHFNGVVRCHEDSLLIPMRWKKPRLIFVNSMGDLFHKDVPFEFIDRVFAVMALCPHHTFQVLTKRPERMAEYFDENDGLSTPFRVWHQKQLLQGSPEDHNNAYDGSSHPWPLPNVWLGTSVEDQTRADERIPHLMKCPAAVRFLSCEPLLGPLDLSAYFGGAYVGLPGDVVHENYNFGIDWVIVGGESGPGARPCNVAWIRSIVQQCKAAGVPCFVKQLGSHVLDRFDRSDPEEWPTETLHDPKCDDAGNWRMRPKSKKGGDMAEWPEDLRVREMPEVSK